MNLSVPISVNGCYLVLKYLARQSIRYRKTKHQKIFCCSFCSATNLTFKEKYEN